MSIADELEKLDKLRASGALTEAEYHRAKQHVLDGTPPVPSIEPGTSPPSEPNPLKRFRRSSKDCVIGGVCGGLAKLVPAIPSWVWRIGFFVAILGYGTGLVVYVLLWIFVPPDDADM